MSNTVIMACSSVHTVLVFMPFQLNRLSERSAMPGVSMGREACAVSRIKRGMI
ncbi:MAG: hypothetical protein OEM42_04075 [Deltaproteobacteria bacterium]|nr:hypothetical protein [Deltaproteobacteria bacterium]